MILMIIMMVIIIITLLLLLRKSASRVVGSLTIATINNSYGYMSRPAGINKQHSSPQTVKQKPPEVPCPDKVRELVITVYTIFVICSFLSITNHIIVWYIIRSIFDYITLSPLACGALPPRRPGHRARGGGGGVADHESELSQEILGF